MFKAIQKYFAPDPVVPVDPVRIRTPKSAAEARKHLRRILQIDQAGNARVTCDRRAEYLEDVRARKLMLDAYGLSNLNNRVAVRAALDALDAQGNK
jgi:hypothetical protein